MKAVSQCVFMACGLAVPVVGRSDIFCLTRDDCKQRQNELGLKKFKSGRYSNMGRGCFSKFDTLYWSTGGSYEQKTTYDLGWSAKVRVTCGEAEQISTVAPSNAPTTTPTNVPTSTLVVTDAPTKSTLPTSYETEHEVATNSTSNYTVHQNLTLQDDSDAELTEDVLASAKSDNVEGTNNTSNETEVESAVQVEVAESYLTDSKPAEASHRFLEIGAAGVSVGLLFVAALIHRTRQKSKSQHRNNEIVDEASVENSRSDSFDTNDISTNTLAQNMIEMAEIASKNTDGMSCWTPTDYYQHSLDDSSSFGDEISEQMWSSVGTSNSASIGTDSTYKDENSVKTAKISNIT